MRRGRKKVHEEYKQLFGQMYKGEDNQTFGDATKGTIERILRR